MRISYKVILFLFLNFPYFCYGAAAARLPLQANIPEEGWRWHQNLTLKLSEDKMLSFKEIHKALAQVELSISTRWEDKAEGTVGNIAVGAISVIYKVGADYGIITAYISADSTLDKLILFESGTESSLASGDPEILASRAFKPYTVKELWEKPNTFMQHLKTHFESGVAEVLNATERGARARECESRNVKLFAHSEQGLRLYLNEPENLGILATKIAFQMALKGIKDPVIQGAVLHIHTRLDMCRRCAQTWAIESLMEASDEGLFPKIREALRAKHLAIDASYKSFIFVSARDTHKGDSRFQLGLGDRDIEVPLPFDATPRMFQHALVPMYLPLADWVKDAPIAPAASAGAGGSGSASR